jgi:hypothetical protein
MLEKHIKLATGDIDRHAASLSPVQDYLLTILLEELNALDDNCWSLERIGIMYSLYGHKGNMMWSRKAFPTGVRDEVVDSLTRKEMATYLVGYWTGRTASQPGENVKQLRRRRKNVVRLVQT